MTLAPIEAHYRVIVRNSGDEVVLSDEDLQQIIAEYLDTEYAGVLGSVEVERITPDEIARR